MKHLFHIPERRFVSAILGSAFVVGIVAFRHTDAVCIAALPIIGTLWGGLMVSQHREAAQRREGEKK